MSDQNGDQSLPAGYSGKNSQLMNGGKLAVMPTGAFVATPPAQFRMGPGIFAGRCDRLVAGAIAYALYI